MNKSFSSPHDTIRLGCFLLNLTCLTGILWIYSIFLLGKSVKINLPDESVESSANYTLQCSNEATATSILKKILMSKYNT